MTSPAQLWLNDQPVHSTATTVADFIQQQQLSGSFVLALNGHYLSASDYGHTRLQYGDRLELLRPIAGG